MAARASALAIALGVAFGIFGVIKTMGGGTEAMEAMMVENAQGDPDVAGMAGVMAGAAVFASIAMVVVQAILGLVQWAKPTGLSRSCLSFWWPLVWLRPSTD